MRLSIAVLCFTSLFSVVALAAPLYSWTGTDGQTHYGDQPPPLSHAKLVQGNNSNGSGADGQVASKDGSTPATANADECQKQKDKLVSYNAAAKITETDALGSTRDYSPEERQKLIDVTQQRINQTCK